MIRHIVTWKFRPEAEGAGRQTNLLNAKALLEACAALPTGTRTFEVALAESGRD